MSDATVNESQRQWALRQFQIVDDGKGGQKRKCPCCDSKFELRTSGTNLVGHAKLIFFSIDEGASFWQIWNMSVGFFGIQFGFAQRFVETDQRKQH